MKDKRFFIIQETYTVFEDRYHSEYETKKNTSIKFRL